LSVIMKTIAISPNANFFFALTLHRLLISGGANLMVKALRMCEDYPN
jgi:hypothetical protein